MSSISKKAKQKISLLIDDVVNSYLKKAVDSPKEDSGNPFIYALLKDFEPLLHRIHGLKTSLGNQLEKIAEIIAKESWGQENVKRKENVNVELPRNVFQTIDTIINNLSNSKKLPNYLEEKSKIIDACKNPSSDLEQHTYEFDLTLFDEAKSHWYHLEMKGPDPNTTEVPGAKKRLMIALAKSFLQNKTDKVDSLFAIYYNNKHPNPFKNPKVLYYFDPDGGLLIQNDFWNFLGRDPSTYQQLLALFSSYGRRNKARIWTGFSRLIRKR